MPLFGKLGDLYGHRRIYVLGFGTATVFSVLTALAWNPLSLIIARTISQIGGGATGTAAIALVAAQLPAGQRARAIGMLNVAGGLAPVLGVVIGGPAVDAIGWRALFLIQAVPAFIAWAMALVLLTETAAATRCALRYGRRVHARCRRDVGHVRHQSRSAVGHRQPLRHRDHAARSIGDDQLHPNRATRALAAAAAALPTKTIVQRVRGHDVLHAGVVHRQLRARAVDAATTVRLFGGEDVAAS